MPDPIGDLQLALRRTVAEVLPLATRSPLDTRAE
jgi:hypothetical protein